MKVKRICENQFCCKEFKADTWDVRRNRGRFCCVRCVSEWMSVRMTKRHDKKEPKAG